MFKIEHLPYYHNSQTYCKYIHISRFHRLDNSNLYDLVTEDSFILANSTDPDEMLHSAAFHLGLGFLPKYLFWGFH